MIPKWLYVFNHWLWTLSFWLILIVCAIELLMLLFKLMPYEVTCFIVEFNKWFFPASLAGFIVGSGLCINYVGQEMRKKK